MSPQAFGGATFQPEQDGERLLGQLERVKKLMEDGRWHGLQEIAQKCRCSESSAGARLRDLRKEQFGKHTIERRRVEGGLFAYRLKRE